MTKSHSKKLQVVNPENIESKSLPLITTESKEIFSARKHSMDYVTVNGVILRTGYHDKTDWYLLLIKELLDNAIDFLWKKYQGASDATINVDITIDDSFFHIKIRNVNNNIVQDNDKINFEKELVKTLTSPSRKAAIKIDAPRLHPIAIGWKNVSSIHSYMPEEFAIVLTSVYDKQETSVYDVLRTFKDGTNMKKSTNNQISIAELIQDPSRHEKIETLFHELRNVFGSVVTKSKLSLPYSISSQERKQALIQRITSLFPNQLDSNKGVYKIIHGNYNDDDLKKVWSEDGETYHDEKGKGMLHFPYAIEIIAIPYHENLLEGDVNQATRFIGSVNYSISPRGNIFEGDYDWIDEKLGWLRAKDITEILNRYGFQFYAYADSKVKLPCVIAANLISPRVDYHGHDKSRIDTHPFSSAIIDAAKAMADGIQTFRAAGYTFSIPKRMISYVKPEKKKYKAEDVLMEYLTKRKEAMGL